MKPTDLELDQLLARGRLSGRQYDEIARRVLRRSAPTRRRWVFVAFSSSLATALVLLLVLPRVLERGQPALPAEAEGSGFRAKGAASAEAAHASRTAPSEVGVGCAGRPARVCRMGDTLLISLTGARPGFVAAYAQRVDDPAAPRVWYFEATSGDALENAAGVGTIVLPRGVRLAPPHRPGKYRLTLWISPAPLSSDERARFAEGAGGVELRSVEFRIVK